MPNWFSVVKEKVLNFFSVKKSPAGDSSEVEKTPQVEISRQPGLSCPECGTKLFITMESLLNYLPVQCHGCGLELTIDREKSKSSIESLRKLKMGLDEAESVKQRGQL